MNLFVICIVAKYLIQPYSSYYWSVVIVVGVTVSYCTSAYSSFVVIRTCAAESTSPPSTSPPSTHRKNVNGVEAPTHGRGTVLPSRRIRPLRLQWRGVNTQRSKGLLRSEKGGMLRRNQRLPTRHRSQQWQPDFVDLSNLRKDKYGPTFLLTVINIFWKVTWCIPLKNKSASSMVAAFNTLLVDIAPTTLQTDKGLEFLN